MPYRLARRASLLLRSVPVLLALSAVSVHAADEFAVTPAQLKALGVELHRLGQPAPIAGPAYPAQVVLPPSQEYVLSAPLAGVVEQLLVGENDLVQAGQPLLRLVSPELGELQLRLSEAASKVRLSQKALQRERLLFADGIIPERRVQEAESMAGEDQARLRQAQSALRLAGADPAAIQRVADGGALQEALLLRARTPGVVVKLEVKPGQRAQQADALVRIADLRKLWLDIQIPVERQAQVALKGAAVTGIDRELSAKTLSFGAMVSDSQTVKLRAEVTRGAAGLRLGEFVQVRVPFASSPAASPAASPVASPAASAASGTVGSEQGWPVPIPAVVRQGDKAYVFVRSDKGFIAQPVTVLESAGQSMRIAGALRSGQEIAVTSVIALKAAWLGKGGSN